jgi:hypothetical protein
MTTTAVLQITWRKTRDGEWVVCGPAKILRQCLRTRTAVDVTKRSGEVQYVQLTHVGKTFGDGLAYGYIAEQGNSRPTASGQTCDECDGRGASHHRTDSSGISGIVCDRCSREPSYALSFA